MHAKWTSISVFFPLFIYNSRQNSLSTTSLWNRNLLRSRPFDGISTAFILLYSYHRCVVRVLWSRTVLKLETSKLVMWAREKKGCSTNRKARRRERDATRFVSALLCSQQYFTTYRRQMERDFGWPVIMIRFILTNIVIRSYLPTRHLDISLLQLKLSRIPLSQVHELPRPRFGSNTAMCAFIVNPFSLRLSSNVVVRGIPCVRFLFFWFTDFQYCFVNFPFVQRTQPINDLLNF